MLELWYQLPAHTPIKDSIRAILSTTKNISAAICLLLPVQWVHEMTFHSVYKCCCSFTSSLPFNNVPTYTRSLLSVATDSALNKKTKQAQRYLKYQNCTSIIVFLCVTVTSYNKNSENEKMKWHMTAWEQRHSTVWCIKCIIYNCVTS